MVAASSRRSFDLPVFIVLYELELLMVCSGINICISTCVRKLLAASPAYLSTVSWRKSPFQCSNQDPRDDNSSIALT